MEWHLISYKSFMTYVTQVQACHKMFGRSYKANILCRFRSIHTAPKTLKFNPLVYNAPYKYNDYYLFRIGNRETVGYGWNGEPTYLDRTLFPFPSIRYKEPTQKILALHEREKGDWKLLSIADKKELYRASFCQTFAEFKTPRPGTVFETLGYCLMWISAALWTFVFVEWYVNPELPKTFTPSSKRAQMRRQINMQNNPIEGIASEWDYEKMDWKKKGWFTPPNPFVSCPDDFEEWDDDDN